MSLLTCSSYILSELMQSLNADIICETMVRCPYPGLPGNTGEGPCRARQCLRP